VNVQLRPVLSTDLRAFFDHQSDPVAVAMAAVKSQNNKQFFARWNRLICSTEIYLRTIDVKDQVAGSICCFPSQGQSCVGYFLGREYWGQGVATEALRLLLSAVQVRPLQAYVAEHNLASARVLEKNGFQEVDRRHSAETDRYIACTEVVYRLPGNLMSDSTK
jgi:RimJ/RimL family protein N-acetyltransferase